MKGRQPTAEEKRHMKKVAALGCIVCLLFEEVFTPASIHHMEGKTKPGAHFKALPLCFRHHQEGSCCDEWVSRHPHKARFEERYGTEEQLLEHVNKLIGVV